MSFSTNELGGDFYGWDRGVSVSPVYAGRRLLLGEMESSLIAKYRRGCIKNKLVAYKPPPPPTPVPHPPVICFKSV